MLNCDLLLAFAAMVVECLEQRRIRLRSGNALGTKPATVDADKRHDDTGRARADEDAHDWADQRPEGNATFKKLATRNVKSNQSPSS
jgi:hypothetical protein